MKAILTAVSHSVNVGEYYGHPKYTFVGLASPLNNPSFELKIVNKDLQSVLCGTEDYNNEFDIEIIITANPKPKKIHLK